MNGLSKIAKKYNNCHVMSLVNFLGWQMAWTIAEKKQVFP